MRTPSKRLPKLGDVKEGTCLEKYAGVLRLISRNIACGKLRTSSSECEFRVCRFVIDL